MCFANIDEGYLEGILRGYRAGILTSSDYANLCQCETIDGAATHPHALPRACAPFCERGPAAPALYSPRLRRGADMKMHLASTDYGNFMQNEPGVTTTVLAARATVRAPAQRSTSSFPLPPCPSSSPRASSAAPRPCPPRRPQDKLVEEFEFLRRQAVEPLATFLDYITYSYMIDNVVLLITGTLHNRDVEELYEKCHPLGLFESPELIKNVVTCDNSVELYRLVLVDTPLGRVT